MIQQEKKSLAGMGLNLLTGDISFNNLSVTNNRNVPANFRTFAHYEYRV